MVPNRRVCFLWVCSCSLLLSIACKASVAPTLVNDATPTIQTRSTAQPQPVTPAASNVLSIYNENISSPPAERFSINEVELMLDAVQLLVETSWNGSSDMPLPITVADFDKAKLEAYIADEMSDIDKLTIPSDLEPLYISSQAADELGQLILQAQQEYVAYLVTKGALQQYVDELAQSVLPADPARMVYHPDNDPEAPPTATEGLVIDADGRKDYSRLQLNVYPVDIYNRVMMLQRSGIIGPESGDEAARMAYQRQLRDMATRQLVYHEMTHALQRAYVNLHVSAQEKTYRTAWNDASKTLIHVDTQYHWQWGQRTFSDMNNRHVSDESQAEGISFQVFVDVYNMSPQQRDAVWDHFFGRLENGQKSLDQIRQLFEAHYPRFMEDEFSDLLLDVMDDYPDVSKRRILTRLALRLSALPAYVGYLNPMLPQDTYKVWDALRQP